MGVTLFHDSFKLSYTEGLVSQVFCARSLTPGAAKPAPDLKPACTNQHLMGQPPVCPCQHWNAEEDIKPTSWAGQAQGFECRRLSWADVEAPCSRPGARGPAWRGPGTEGWHCLRCHRARNLSRALLPQPRGGCRPHATHWATCDPPQVAVTCKTTQWPNIPWLYTGRSAEEVEY